MGPLVQPLHKTATTTTKDRLDDMQNELQTLTTAWSSQSSQMAAFGSNISEMVTMMQTMQSQMLRMNSEITEMAKTKADEVLTLSGVSGTKAEPSSTSSTTRKATSGGKTVPDMIIESSEDDSDNEDALSQVSMKSTKSNVTSSKKSRHVDINKLKLPDFKRGSVEESQNTIFSMENLLSSVQLLEAARGKDTIVTDQDESLFTLLVKWVEQEASIVTDIRTNFTSRSGRQLFQHLKAVYLLPAAEEVVKAEDELTNFEFGTMFDGNAENTRKLLIKFWDVIERQHPSRKGTVDYWTERLMHHFPPAYRQEFDKFLRLDEAAKYVSKVYVDKVAFNAVCSHVSTRLVEAQHVEVKRPHGATIQARAHGGIRRRSGDESDAHEHRTLRRKSIKRSHKNEDLGHETDAER